ncbi:hypothetical protein EPYR_02027 [Erwinia pyrifoliae DSM 12163]|nr:hypothetical protein EPYR_02027 [Erwinia pyrifoliae DSM 12163]
MMMLLAILSPVMPAMRTTWKKGLCLQHCWLVNPLKNFGVRRTIKRILLKSEPER